MAIHGVVVKEGAIGGPPIDLPDISTIGIIATAPGIDVDGMYGENGRPKYQKPQLITSLGDVPSSEIGTEGTAPGAFAAIFAQTRAKVVWIPIPEFEAATAMTGIATANYVASADTFAVSGTDREFKVNEVDEGFEIVINTATWTRRTKRV